MAEDPRIADLTATCAMLRDTLRTLLEAVALYADEPRCAWAMALADAALAQTSGVQAEAQFRLHVELARCGYTLADYLYPLVFRVPRSAGKLPTLEDVERTLQEIQALTRQTWLLDDVPTASQEVPDGPP